MQYISHRYRQSTVHSLCPSVRMGLVVLLFSVQAALALAPTSLKTEYIENPQGIDVLRPRLSWILTASGRAQMQTAYQVQAAPSPAQLASGSKLDWDSGKVDSGRNFGIVYGGPELTSGVRCYWRVRVWDQEGKASPWSPAAWWEMGLLNAADWKGKWIGTAGDLTSPLLRKDFQAAGVIQKATAYVYALGFYELYLDGAKVGDSVLTPVNSDYKKNLYYDTYDVTRLLRRGGNAVGLWLGNGYDRNYNQYGYRWMSAKQAILELNIQYADGSQSQVVTDESWKAAPSPILANSIYNGDTYDARREKPGWDRYGYDARDWQAVQIMPEPSGRLRCRLMPPIKVLGTVRPVAMHEPKPGVFVFDLGQSIAGWTRVRARGPAGTTIVLRHAELLLPDGTLNTHTNRSAKATDTFMLKGSGVEVYEPRFTYHGYRYIQMTGYPGTPTLDTVEGRVVHDAFQSAGTFHSSDPLLNRIQLNFQWGLVNNLMGIPTDNPVRNERTPCQMDSMVAEDTAIDNFNMNTFYAKWLQDISGGRDAPNWAGDQVLLAWRLYQQYGNRRAIEENYENSKQLVDAFAAQAAKPHAWADAFGDWCPPGQDGHYEHCFSEGQIVNTAVDYRATLLVAKMAAVLGRTADAATYSERAEAILRQFNSQEFSAADHVWGSGRQVTSVLPLAFDMAPPDQQAAAAKALCERLTDKNHGHLDTGIFGTRYLFDVLIDNGYADAAFEALNQTTYPSYGDQIRQGATTTWEQWHYLGGMETHDHQMFAGPGSTFYSRLAGIRPAQPGYKEVLIEPAFPRGLTSVTCSLHTMMGEIVSNWKVQNGLRMDITIPPNSTAIVYVPASAIGQVKEGGRPVAQSVGVRVLKLENGRAVLAVASGTYRFTSSGVGAP